MPKLLDLFCKAGGTSVGYAQAGFEVFGVDINPQPHYPFGFRQADVFALSLDFLRGFDVVHASPPCQGYTELRHAPGTKGAPRLIGATRRLLQEVGRPFIIENVEDARAYMQDPILLCGSMFGLGAQGCSLQRHRLFEISPWLPLKPPPCRHSDGPVIGVYGAHARKRSAKHGGRGTRDEWVGGHRTAASQAMGIDWMTLAEMSEAIPPAYTKWIGEHTLCQLAQG